MIKSGIMFPNKVTDVMANVIIPKDKPRFRSESQAIVPQDNDQKVVHQDKSQDSDIPTIIDADKFMAMTLDDISLKLDTLASLLIRNQQTLSSLLDCTMKNESRLAIIEREMLAEADSGEFIRTNGTVTTAQFVIIDTMVAPGHMVKGYTVKNDGPNTIYVAHNAAVSSNVDADIVDVTTDTSRFEQVLVNEDVKFIFNRRRIRNVHILASGGDSAFRAWLTW